jgi:GNAT superfamily N-acetyltransferase
MPAGLDFRSVGPADIDLLAEIDPRIAPDPARRAHMVHLLDSGMSWAALQGGEGVGFAIVTRHFYALPLVDLLFVAEPHRRGGVGRALMDHCEASHDTDRMFTSTNESNLPMRALLAKAGWRPAGVVNYLDPGDPELIFVKLRG